MTDEHVPPIGPGDDPLPLEGEELSASISADDDLSSGGARGSIHPAVQDLSAFLDAALTLRETAIVTHHIDACTECRRELQRLGSARRLFQIAGRPSAPPDVVESAIAAALESADSASKKERAMAHHRYVQVVAKAAAAVLVLGAIGGGVYGVMRMSQSATSSTSALMPLRAASGKGEGSKVAKQPPAGVFALQLRASTGAAPCSEAGRPDVESVDGTRIVVNPPAPKPAVVRERVAAGQPTTCIGVGPAFATLWSADISHVTIEPLVGSSTPSSTTAAGPDVDVAVAFAPDAVTDSATLDRALKGELTVEVIEQGTDLGTATVAKGPVVTLRVSRSLAIEFRDRLVTNSRNSG